MPKLFSDLRNHGVSILASNILFQEHHTKENIWKEVEYMKNLRPDFTQFMQLGPLPQTALYKEYKENGKLCMKNGMDSTGCGFNIRTLRQDSRSIF